MTLLFKVIGFALIIFTASAIGFFKSNQLSQRSKKLEDIQKSIGTLKEHIRMGDGEIERLLKLSFNQYPINYNYLEKGDIELIEDFFKTIGMQDTKAEYERCELYINLLKSKTEEANIKYRETGRLYKNIGFLGGVFICIFLL